MKVRGTDTRYKGAHFSRQERKLKLGEGAVFYSEYSYQLMLAQPILLSATAKHCMIPPALPQDLSGFHEVWLSFVKAPPCLPKTSFKSSLPPFRAR